MATSFEGFVNSELPKRPSIPVPAGGNLPAGKKILTTGVGMGLEAVDNVSDGATAAFDGSSASPPIAADNVQDAILEVTINYYQQAGEPTLGANERFAFWEDGSNRVFLVAKRPSDGQQVGVQLSR